MGALAIYLSPAARRRWTQRCQRFADPVNVNFPRQLGLSLVILLKITHQLERIWFLIGPQHTCHISLPLDPEAIAKRKVALRRVHSWSIPWRTFIRTIKFFIPEKRAPLFKYRDKEYRTVIPELARSRWSVCRGIISALETDHFHRLSCCVEVGINYNRHSVGVIVLWSEENR